MSAILKNDRPLDLGSLLFEQIKDMNNATMSGITAGAAGVWIKMGPAMSALEKQWRAAQADPQAKIPAGLSLAIDSVLRQVAQAQPASVYGERRSQPRDGSGDMSVDGRPLEPGK